MFILSTEKEIIGNKQKASLSYKDFAKDVKKGDKVLVDDGKLIFEVISTNKKDEVKLRNIKVENYLLRKVSTYLIPRYLLHL